MKRFLAFLFVFFALFLIGCTSEHQEEKPKENEESEGKQNPDDEEPKQEVKTYVITYDFDDGSCEKVVESFSDFSSVTLKIPTNDKREFVGWYENGTLVERLSENRNYNLVAKWKEITPEEIVIEATIEHDQVYIGDKIQLVFTVLPAGVSQEVNVKVSSKSHASIDSDNVFTCDQGGKYTVTAISSVDSTIKATYVIEVADYYSPYHLLDVMVASEIIAKDVTSFQSTHNTDTYVITSLTNYLFEDLVVIENFVPEGRENRPGKVSSSGNAFSLRYVTVHDVGFTGTARVTSNNCVNSTNTSWHYSTGNDGIYQQLPHDEIGWHAGDGTGTPLEFYDTGVKAPVGDDTPAKVTINQITGCFEMNGVATTIKAPLNSSANRIVRNDELPYTGINNYVDATTGTYWIGRTHWDKTYLTLGNYGGNLNSIGIETSVYEGSDLVYTWQKTAKLIAVRILKPHYLLPRDVKQHNTFSGKDCPMTMRHANMWEYFIGCVECEYLITKYYKDWTIELICDSPYVNEKGRVISLPDTEEEVSFKIRVSNNSDFDKTFDYSIKLPAKSNLKNLSNILYVNYKKSFI